MKKLLMIALLFVLLCGSVQAEVKTHFYGGGKVIVPAGNTEGWGLGSMLGIGVELSDKVIVWGNVNNTKPDEGFDVDEYLVGTYVLTSYLIEKIKTGAYFGFEGGWSKLEELKSKFGSLCSVGFYSDITPTTKFYLGGGYSYTKGIKLYAIQAGISVVP